MKDRTYGWAILGTGVIANEMARALCAAGRTIRGVGSRTWQKAANFAEVYGIPVVYENLQELFLDDGVDIVYIATPHNTHDTYIMEALRRGKHVLCEKAVTLNSGQLKAAVSLAREQRLVLAEAMTIYHMPLYRQLRQILDSGRLGQVRMIQLSFGSRKPYDMGNRFFNRALAGGALLDIGVYALSFARWFMSSKPDRIQSLAGFAPSGVDERSGIVMMNPEGQVAAILLSLNCKQPKRGVVSCDKGFIEIMEYPRADRAVIVSAEDGSRQEVLEGDPLAALRYELEDMERCCALGSGEGMMLEFSQDVMELATRLRGSWGLVYPEEEAPPEQLQ